VQEARSGRTASRTRIGCRPGSKAAPAARARRWAGRALSRAAVAAGGAEGVRPAGRGTGAEPAPGPATSAWRSERDGRQPGRAGRQSGRPCGSLGLCGSRGRAGSASARGRRQVRPGARRIPPSIGDGSSRLAWSASGDFAMLPGHFGSALRPGGAVKTPSPETCSDQERGRERRGQRNVPERPASDKEMPPWAGALMRSMGRDSAIRVPGGAVSGIPRSIPALARAPALICRSPHIIEPRHG
jgi:hypothetical protein